MKMNYPLESNQIEQLMNEFTLTKAAKKSMKNMVSYLMLGQEDKNDINFVLDTAARCGDEAISTYWSLDTFIRDRIVEILNADYVY